MHKNFVFLFFENVIPHFNIFVLFLNKFVYSANLLSLSKSMGDFSEKGR